MMLKNTFLGNRIFVTILLMAAFLVASPVISLAEEVNLEISAESAPDVPAPEELIGPIFQENSVTKNDDVDHLQAGEENITNPLPPQHPPSETKDVRGYQVFKGNDFYENNSFVESLLFSDTEKELLYTTLNSKVNSGIMVASQTEEPGKKSNLIVNNFNNNSATSSIKEFQAPSFYLKSILMPESDNWTIWLNDLRIRNFDIDKIKSKLNLEIKKVTQTKVTFLFKDDNLDYISPKYKETLEKIPSGKWDYRSKKGDIFVNSKEKTVKFTIGISQTFSSFGMKVSEGYIASTSVPNPDYAEPQIGGSGIIPQAPITTANKAAANLSRGIPQIAGEGK